MAPLQLIHSNKQFAQLRRTSGAVSRDLLNQTLQRLGLEENDAQSTEPATLVGA